MDFHNFLCEYQVMHAQQLQSIKKYEKVSLLYIKKNSNMKNAILLKIKICVHFAMITAIQIPIECYFFVWLLLIAIFRS